MRGRKPKPTHLKLLEGNPGKRALNGAEPKPPRGIPTCPAHLTAPAKAEWKRLAQDLHTVGLLTLVDRGALAAYCQSWGRWVEAERKLQETPHLFKTPAGYVQISPWLTIANKERELMARYMTELGLTPSSRSRLAVQFQSGPKPWEFGAEVSNGPSASDLLQDRLAKIAERQKAVGELPSIAGPK
jgi:P27 family predicted phage terminase small subunit